MKSKLVWALLLLFPLSALSAIGPWTSRYCYWERYVNTNRPNCSNCPPLICQVWPYSHRGVPYTVQFVAAVVTDSNVAVTATSAEIDQTLVPTDGNVTEAHRGVLVQELQSRGLYNATTQEVAFFQSTGPFAISDNSCGLLSVMLNGGVQLSQGRAVGLVAASTDLDDGSPVTPLMLVDSDLSLDPPPAMCVPIPTLSQWGLIILALLVLTTGSWLAMEAQRPAAVPGNFVMRVIVRGPPWVASVFFNVLTVILGLAAVGFSIALVCVGSIGPADVAGTLVSAVVSAYWVHLLILSRKTPGAA